VYRAACGNFDYFLNTLDNILHSPHKHKTEFIICGDININYLETNNKQEQLNNLLCTYNLMHYTIKTCINGLSDRDTKLITLNNFSVAISNIEPT
jgi:meiotically up-regulated gene 157 (Mug157) protein